MTTQTTITIEPHEIGGLAEFVGLQLDCAGDDFHAIDDRRAYLDYMRDLLDITDALADAGGEPVTLEAGATLLRLIREGSAESPRRLGDALRGLYDDQEAVIRQTKGLMSLGQRLGVYEGVVV